MQFVVCQTCVESIEFEGFKAFQSFTYNVALQVIENFIESLTEKITNLNKFGKIKITAKTFMHKKLEYFRV